jgi:hypothetical protein
MRSGQAIPENFVAMLRGRKSKARTLTRFVAARSWYGWAKLLRKPSQKRRESDFTSVLFISNDRLQIGCTYDNLGDHSSKNTCSISQENKKEQTSVLLRFSSSLVLIFISLSVTRRDDSQNTHIQCQNAFKTSQIW